MRMGVVVGFGFGPLVVGLCLELVSSGGRTFKLGAYNVVSFAMKETLEKSFPLTLDSALFLF